LTDTNRTVLRLLRFCGLHFAHNASTDNKSFIYMPIQHHMLLCMLYTRPLISNLCSLSQ